MKYCSKCGNQLFDEAVICPKCGCPVTEVKVSAISNIKDKKRLILSIVGLVFFLISILLYAAPFVTIEAGIFSKSISGFQIAFDISKNSFYILLSFFLCIGGFILLLFNIIAPNWRINEKNILQKPNDTIKKTIIYEAILYTFFGAISLIINAFSVSISGFSDTASASLGFGAISSGVFSMLAWGVVTAADTMWLLKKAEENNINLESKPNKDNYKKTKEESDREFETKEKLKTVLLILLVVCSVIAMITMIVLLVLGII